VVSFPSFELIQQGPGYRVEVGLAEPVLDRIDYVDPPEVPGNEHVEVLLGDLVQGRRGQFS